MLAARNYFTCPNGLILPEHVAEQSYVSRIPIAIDFFAGCGGLSLGYKQAGWDVIAASEWDAAAAVTYMTNLCRYGDLTIHFADDDARERLEKYLSKMFGKGDIGKPVAVAGTGWISNQPRSTPGTRHFFFGDIRKFSGVDIMKAIGMKKGEVDCVAGGPPCQGFSTAGKQNIMDPRNSLVFEFARMVLDINPKTMFFENVPGIVNMVTPEGVPVLDAMARILEDGSFMTIDAFKQSMKAQGVSVGFLRGNSKPKKERNELENDPTDGVADAQIELFTSA